MSEKRRGRARTLPPQPSGRVISIRGARVHNLKNIDLDLPGNRLIVVTGVSGSGKSSLVFDTIYAEGQRRYVESLSAYARQFLERMEKPDVDSIRGIGPAIAIEQKTSTKNPRSTVGTSTEIYDYLRLLFARIGRTMCGNCGREVRRESVHSVLEHLTTLSGKKEDDGPREDVLKIHVAFPLHVHEGESVAAALAAVKKEGFFRLLRNGEVIDIRGTDLPGLDPAEQVLVLVDRAVFRPGEENARLVDSLETAFASGSGNAVVAPADRGEARRFNRNFACASCGIPYEEPEPRLFSFNSPFGACPRCQGFGRAVGIDMDLVVPDKSRTLRDGAIQPWTTPKFAEIQRRLISVAKKARVRVDIPYEKLDEYEVGVVLDGFEHFEGVTKFFARVERKAYKIFYRVMLSRYRGYTRCSLCGGSRLRPEALNVRVGGKRISDIAAMTVDEALSFVGELKPSAYDTEVAGRILSELVKRLTYLRDVGIGYLTLDRVSSSLSGGESQRINLATSLGSSLVGSLYVLDEPSIGLHPKDNRKLIRILKTLRDVGNSVLVVEHDREMILSADHVVDLGPAAGERGGEVVCSGAPDSLADCERSITGRYLRGAASIPVPSKRRRSEHGAITVRNARQHNLRGIDVSFPLGLIVCVTGVSGSGKSTLVDDVLRQGLRRMKGDLRAPEPNCEKIEGSERIDSIECVDQSPIGRTPRSNAVTYVGAFDHIRGLFAGTQASRVHGFKPGHFSFNVPGGRCEACEGDGVVKIEMQFMADLYLTCDACKGMRYQKEVLGVFWNGKNIHDVLDLPVSEAIRFFSGKAEGRKVAAKLRVLEDVGLGYIRLGQPATSLSGGEAQRVKLAAHLGTSAAQRTLFLFDEPTTGLHFDDIAKLLTCFNALVDAGHSVIIIEHNLDVIKCADHVIDLGPEAGSRGGTVVGSGTPEELAANEASSTGACLKSFLE